VFSAYNSAFDDIVNARIASKKESYYCWACKKPLILKQGHIIQPHFAHQAKETCGDGWSHPSKTRWHRQMQDLFDTTEVLMEDKETGERHIADAVSGDVVFEFQHSSISAEEVLQRSLFYNHQKYHVVWVVDASTYFKKGKIYIRDFDENVYCWSRPLRLFDMLPFLDYPNEIRVVLYWEDYEGNGFLNHVAWAHQDVWYEESWDDDEEGRYMSRPDMRVFAVSKRQSLTGVTRLNPSDFFCKYNINTTRCQEIANSFFEERELIAQQFRYY